MRGYFWFARRYGLRALWRYERARRAGATIDYSTALTADERAVLEEHFLKVPWRSCTSSDREL